MKKNKGTITQEIIHKVHLTLSDIQSGEDILSFLKQTEPVFMTEVTRFVQAELYRLKHNMHESQVNYIGSVIAAAYIAGFLIAREAAHKTYNGLINYTSPIDKALDSEEIDELIDKYRSEGKSNKEIAGCIRKHLNIDGSLKQEKTAPRKKKSRSKKKTKRLDINDIGL